jgi:hypothetical protein
MLGWALKVTLAPEIRTTKRGGLETDVEATD